MVLKYTHVAFFPNCNITNMVEYQIVWDQTNSVIIEVKDNESFALSEHGSVTS